MELELLQWGDGEIRLSFEDRINGKDRHFILDADGCAYEESDDEDRHPVNLVAELRALYDEMRRERA